MNKTVKYIIFIGLMCFLGACTAGTNPSVWKSDVYGEVSGFWLGLWHGLIVVIAFIVSLFDSTVQVYEVHNTGAMYNLGFLLGIRVFWDGAKIGANAARE